MSNPISRLNAALSGRYRIERQRRRAGGGGDEGGGRGRLILVENFFEELKRLVPE